MQQMKQMKRYGAGILLTALLGLSACGGGGSASSTPPPPPPPLPPAPTLAAAIDAYAQSSMAVSGASAVSFSIIKGGEPLYEKSYGTAAHPLFRTASVIKPVTAAVVQQLAATGRLALSDHAFCTGDNAPCWLSPALLPAGYDARVRQITIGQLIGHQGGWNRQLSGDPAAMEAGIRDALAWMLHKSFFPQRFFANMVYCRADRMCWVKLALPMRCGRCQEGLNGGALWAVPFNWVGKPLLATSPSLPTRACIG